MGEFIMSTPTYVLLEGGWRELGHGVCTSIYIYLTFIFVTCVPDTLNNSELNSHTGERSKLILEGFMKNIISKR
jgi:hypothetical protein